MASHLKSQKFPVMPGCFDLWAPRVIAFLLLAVPLVFCLDMDDTFDLPKLTLVYTGSLILLGLWARQAMTQSVLKIQQTRLDLPVAVFLISAGLSTVLSLEPRLSLFGAYGIYVFGWLPLFAFGMLYVLSVQSMSSSHLETIRRMILIAAALVGLYAILQYTGRELFERMPLAVGGRVWSSLGNPIYMGALCMMALPLALDAVLQSGPRETMSIVGQGAALVLIGAGLVLSLSRGAWVGAMVACGLVMWSRRYLLKEHKGVFVILVGILLMGAFLPAVRERASVLFSAQEGSNAARIAGWRGGLQIWKDHFWTGSGTDTFSEAFRIHRGKEFGPSVTQADAHNDFVQVAATQGVLGLLAYLALAVVFFRRAGDAMLHPKLAPYAAGLVALFIQSQFNFSSVATSAWAAIFAGVLFGWPGSEQAPETRSIAVTPFLRIGLLGALIACPIGLWAVSLPFRADVAYKTGLAETGQSRFVYALREYQQAVQLNDRVEVYHSALTNTFRELARLAPDDENRKRYLDAAWAGAQRATAVHAANPDSWNNRGVAAMWMVQLGHREDLRDDARQSFEHAIALDPVFVDAWANLAKWQYLSGHLDQEIILWRKVLDLDPKYVLPPRVRSLVHP